MKREFLMHAKNYKGQNIEGEFISEKVDGIRAFWDGGISTGYFDVPFSNKKGATGLWTRYGNPIHAPLWWIKDLPPIPLDGELWAGYGRRSQTKSIVSRREPDERWKSIRFLIFDSPDLERVFEPGVIDIPHFFKVIDCWDWVKERMRQANVTCFKLPFFQLYEKLKEFKFSGILSLLKQEKLVNLNDFMDKVLKKGGEGAMIRKKYSFWVPERTSNVLKVKPFYDDEGVVVGIKEGKGKHAGRMGSIRVRYKDVEFDLSGFTDEERENPPELGTVITFKYSQLSPDGIPLEARYWRKK